MRTGCTQIALAAGRTALGACLTVLAACLAALAAGPAVAHAAKQADGLFTPVVPGVQVTVTSQDLSQALTPEPDLRWSLLPNGQPIIAVSPAVRYQAVSGFGAAMTDSSAWLIHDHLSAATRAGLMADLFTQSGIDLNFLRVPMGASDFTAAGKPYTYDDTKRPDPQLTHFSIGHDLAYIVPMLQQALSLNPHTFVLATPWTPPAWMKTNDALNNLGHRGVVRQKDLGVLADYFVKFIQAYGDLGIPVSAVTPQNEPTVGVHYPSAQFSAPEEEQFIAGDLAPAISAAGLSTKILGYDNGWSTGTTDDALSLLHSSAEPDISGLAWHCYFGSPTIMTTFHALAPGLQQVVSECSMGISPFSTSELLIGAMRNWATSVAEWNLALNPRGKPVEEPNVGCHGCPGLVTIDEKDQTVQPTIDYYQLGQFSKFVQPGAIRIASGNFTSYAYLGPGLNFARPGLDDVAFENPDGSEVLVAYNNGPAPAGFDLDASGRFATLTLDPGETATLVWDRPLSTASAPYGILPAR